MLPTEQPQLFAFVAEILAAYTKAPNAVELEAWWMTCKGWSLHDVQRAINAHVADEKDGKHAPRPIDVKRLSVASSNSQRCAATCPAGACQYPGIFSDGTQGEGPWYCPWHRAERVGPEAEKWIERSFDIPYAVALEKRAARMAQESHRAPGVTNTAHGMALNARGGHGNVIQHLPAHLKPSEEAA
jgi:hypothetical protein